MKTLHSLRRSSYVLITTLVFCSHCFAKVFHVLDYYQHEKTHAVFGFKEDKLWRKYVYPSPVSIHVDADQDKLLPKIEKVEVAKIAPAKIETARAEITKVEIPKIEPAKNEKMLEVAQQEILLEQELAATDRETQRYFKKASGMLSVGKNVEAIEQLMQLLIHNPHFEPARELVAKLYIDNGNLTDAYHILQMGHAQHPENYRITILLSQVMTAMNFSEAAIRILEENPPSLTTAKDYYAMLAVLYLHKKDYVLARKYYNQLAEAFPDELKFVIGQAIASEQLNDKDKALSYYQQVKTLNGLDIALTNYVQQRIQSLQQVSW